VSSRMRWVERLVGIGLTWGALWLVTAILVGVGIGIADPDSVDPGEPAGLILVMGPMGFLCGLGFGILATSVERRARLSDLSIPRAASCGALGTAIVQIFYLGHGDAGLLANLQMALVFSCFGGVISVGWLVIARRWSYSRSLHQSSR
jgi:hypothetical protein